jgi:HSP20 family protein
MAGLLKRDKTEEAVDVFDRLDHLFDDWMGLLPFRRPFHLDPSWPTAHIRVDEYRENGQIVVRAELPGIDPDKDVELTVTDHTLRIEAERREEETTEDKGYVRKEMRHGTLRRWLPLPDGVVEADITATYENGILEVRIPAPVSDTVKKIAIDKR